MMRNLLALVLSTGAALAQPLPCEPALTGGEGRGNGPASRWEQVAEPDAPGGTAATEVTRLASAERYPLCILPAPVGQDVDVSLTFRPVGGQMDRAGGIAVRLRDANTYYVVRANAAEDNVRLYHVTGGRRVQFAGRERVPLAMGSWHTLRLRLEGDSFTVWLDDAQLFTARDSRIAGPGRFALWSIADSETLFQVPRIDVLR